MPRPRSVFVRGIIAGILAATALAAFFLVVDTLEGEPFRTPAFLATILLGRGEFAIGFGLVALYTVVHYAVFMAVGAAVAWVMSKLPVVPGVLLGIVLGFLLFDLVFYAGLVITGVNVVQALGWPQVLFGNILAGVVLMGYLHLSGAAPAVTWWELLGEHRIIKEGLIAGLLAAAAVALWFFIFDLVSGRPFFTPAALGSIVLGAAATPAEVEITLASVLGYTMIHIAAFLAVGWIAAALAVEAEEASPPLVLAFVLGFVTLEALFIGLVAIFAGWVLDTLGWWTVLIGNLIAAGTVVGYLWRAHPKVARRLRDHRTIEGPA